MITNGIRLANGLFLGPINTSTGLGIASLSLAMAIGQFFWGAVQPVTGALSDRFGPRPVLLGLSLMAFSGWTATVAGWYVTEVGRQPWIVQGLLRVDEVASTVPGAHIALTLALYLTVYAALLMAYVSVVKHMAEKPVPMPEGHDPAADAHAGASGGFKPAQPGAGA